jgi:hypothetical protein
MVKVFVTENDQLTKDNLLTHQSHLINAKSVKDQNDQDDIKAPAFKMF